MCLGGVLRRNSDIAFCKHAYTLGKSCFRSLLSKSNCFVLVMVNACMKLHHELHNIIFKLSLFEANYDVHNDISQALSTYPA